MNKLNSVIMQQGISSQKDTQGHQLESFIFIDDSGFLLINNVPLLEQAYAAGKKYARVFNHHEFRILGIEPIGTKDVFADWIDPEFLGGLAIIGEVVEGIVDAFDILKPQICPVLPPEPGEEHLVCFNYLTKEDALFHYMEGEGLEPRRVELIRSLKSHYELQQLKGSHTKGNQSEMP